MNLILAISASSSKQNDFSSWAGWEDDNSFSFNIEKKEQKTLEQVVVRPVLTLKPDLRETLIRSEPRADERESRSMNRNDSFKNSRDTLVDQRHSRNSTREPSLVRDYRNANEPSAFRNYRSYREPSVARREPSVVRDSRDANGVDSFGRRRRSVSSSRSRSPNLIADRKDNAVE